MIKSSKIEFLPGQEDHFNRLMKIDKEEDQKSTVDKSAPGSGKTEIAIKRAEEKGLEIIPVCPPNVVSVWNQRLKKYEVKYDTIYKYSDFAGTSTRQPRCGFLVRDLTKKPRLTEGEEEPSFTITKKLKDLVDKGCMFIFDECQALKRVSAQSAAVASICRYINETKTKSRVSFLSATFFDKRDFSVNIYKVMGIITDNRLVVRMKSTDTDELRGAQEAFDYCSRFDKEQVEMIKEKYNLIQGYNRYPTKVIIPALYEMFINVIMENCASSMEAPIQVNGVNYFVYLNNCWASFQNRNIRNLHQAIDYNEETQEVKVENIGKLGKTQSRIEQGMCQAMGELVQEFLEGNKMIKVIIYVNYKISVEMLSKQLQKYQPLLLVGKTKQKDRPIIIAKFNEPNANYRLIICSMKVANQGIELDDKIGEFERVPLGMPTYSILDTTQAAGRTDRRDTKSKSTFHSIYPINTMALLPIYDAMAKKGQVLKDVGRSFDGKTPKFPSDFVNKIQKAPLGNDYPPANNSVLISINKANQRLVNNNLLF